jgi:hypothetical protein
VVPQERHSSKQRQKEQLSLYEDCVAALVAQLLRALPKSGDASHGVPAERLTIQPQHNCPVALSTRRSNNNIMLLMLYPDSNG